VDRHVSAVAETPLIAETLYPPGDSLMALADVRNNMLALLRRTDCTTAQANVFIGQGLSRIQRTLRVPVLWLWPILPAGGELIMTYFGQFTPLVNDTDENEATTAFPDLVMYAALAFAGDFFRMDSRDFWNQAYEALLQETQDQASQLDETSGSTAVQSAYCAGDEWTYP
jgi:hypothetical protein